MKRRPWEPSVKMCVPRAQRTSVTGELRRGFRPLTFLKQPCKCKIHDDFIGETWLIQYETVSCDACVFNQKDDVEDFMCWWSLHPWKMKSSVCMRMIRGLMSHCSCWFVPTDMCTTLLKFILWKVPRYGKHCYLCRCTCGFNEHRSNEETALQMSNLAFEKVALQTHSGQRQIYLLHFHWLFDIWKLHLTNFHL